MKQFSHNCLLAALALGLCALALPVQSQTAEALMEVLVRKGILTEQEAEEIKVELARENAEFNNVKAPGKTTQRLELFGDFRGRFEGFYGDYDDFTDRNRFRYRLRVGAKAYLTERFEVGLRLTSSEDVGDGAGGNPISGNTTLRNNGSKKFIFIDQAYARWTALTNVDYQNALIIGKMSNPFEFSSLVFDSDYTPEGIGNQIVYDLNLEQQLSLNLGAFMLDEVSADSDDPYMLGAQLRWDSIWKYNAAHKEKLGTSFGVAGLAISNEENLGNGAVPNINTGNSRDGTNGVLAANFNPIVVDGAVSYWLDSVPCYNGFFPITLHGDYMNNLAESDDNQGFDVGIRFGKAGKKATWQIGYRYRYLEADAWYEELVDSDFGAYYATAPANSGRGSGYRAGTNIKGHIVQAAYTPYAPLTLGLKWFYTELIDAPAGQDESDIHRLQADAMIKF